MLDELQICIDKLLNKILTDNYQLNKSICERFDKIASTMAKQGATPDECVELIKFTNHARHVESFQLQVI